MTILNEFEYFRPKKLEEVLEILYDYKNCAVLAGGTDLINDLKQESKKPTNIIDIKEIKKLGKVKFAKGTLTFGALTTFSDVIENKTVLEKFPLLMEMAKDVASVGVRNRATIVGNICSAVPCLDSGAVLLAFESTIHVSDYYEERDIPITKWFKGPRKTALKKKELVTGVSIIIPKVYGACFSKLKRYRGEDLSQVNLVVVALPNSEYKIAFGAVAATPIRALKIEKLLSKKELSKELLDEAVKLVEDEIAPITDVRASKEYRVHMAKVMLKRALKVAVKRLEGSGPAYGTIEL